MLSIKGGAEPSHTHSSDRWGGWLLSMTLCLRCILFPAHSLTREAQKAPCHARKGDSGTCCHLERGQAWGSLSDCSDKRLQGSTIH